MRKAILFFVLFFGIYPFLFAAPLQERRIEPSALSRLYAFLAIDEEGDIIAQTQQQWLCKPNQERWELDELPDEKARFVLSWAKENGLFDAWTPCLDSYDQALILGATRFRMQMRLDYLKELWLKGTRFDEIVWLLGDRPLDPRVDGNTPNCQTESDVGRFLWERTDLPEEMKALPVRFIAVSMKTQGELKVRPNTQDTLIAWLNEIQAPCRSLFVSDQPFCGYQFGVIKATLPDAFDFDLVGAGENPSNHPKAAAITLDSIARWIYVESLVTQK